MQDCPRSMSQAPAPGSEPTTTDVAEHEAIKLIDWLPESTQPLWELVGQNPLLGALVVVLVFFVAAYIVRFLLLNSLERLLANTHTDLDNEVIRHLRKPIFTTILYFGLALAVQAALLPVGTTFLVNLFLSVIVASWMRAWFLLSTTLLEGLARNHHRFPMVEPHTVPLLDLTVKLLVLLVGSYCLLLIWGINPLGWLASAGIVGIAVGFAAKDTLANLFAGFFILVDMPYKIGDYVNLDSGERGRVTNIGLRSTRLLSRDDIEIILPNAVIANAKIVNESGGPKLNIRVAVPVGVAYGSDVDSICEILQIVADQHQELCSDPAPRVRMRGFGASSLNFELLGWISHPEDRGRILHELYMSIYKAFRSAGIEIPYTKTDVYIKEIPRANSGE
jgi:MscS family membrane protein